MERSVLTLFVATALIASVSSCGVMAGCPESVDQAISGDFPGVGEDSFVAVGQVARFVASPDQESRGYDLDVRRMFSGTASGEGSFLSVPEEVPGIEPGDAVLVIAEPGENSRVIVAGSCTPLRFIGDQELVRWTGDR